MKKTDKRSGKTAMHRRATAKRKKAAKRRKPAAITIRRSSGRKEKFDLDRLAQTTGRSGVPFLIARDIAKKVSRQIRSEAKGKSKKTVTAGSVRSMIAKELRTRNQQATASSYVGEVPENTQRDMTKVDPNESLAGSGDWDSVLHDRSKRLASSA